jgi:hypothetical protein
VLFAALQGEKRDCCHHEYQCHGIGVHPLGGGVGYDGLAENWPIF